MAGRKRQQEEEGGGAPGWMVTYGDMMSLLLTFFVLLISFSTIQQEDFEKAIASLKGALGVLKAEMTLIEFQQDTPQIRAQKFEDVAAKIEEYIRVQGRREDIQVRHTKEGLKLTMQNPVLFDTGEDKLKPVAIPILQDIGELLSELSGNFISVEGHTDNVPIRTERFRSNLELSGARALSVAYFLVSEGGIDEKDVSMRGYGENLPLAPNNSVDNRQKNRRVDVHVLRVRPTASVQGFVHEQSEEIENAS
jgi:chemotaxis protein MotB